MGLLRSTEPLQVSQPAISSYASYSHVLVRPILWQQRFKLLSSADGRKRRYHIYEHGSFVERILRTIWMDSCYNWRYVIVHKTGNVFYLQLKARLHDVVGRRKMLMGSCLGMSIALAIVAATAAEYERSGSTPSSSASIAFIFIFGVIFAVGFTPMQPIYPAEVLASKTPTVQLRLEAAI